MRSTLISASFFAYGLGCIVLNLTTFWVRSASLLNLLSTIFVFLSIVPAFFSFTETPAFQFRMGKITEFINSVSFIAERNKIQDTSKFSFYKKIFHGTDLKFLMNKTVLVKVVEKDGRKVGALDTVYEMITTPKHLYTVVTMSMVSSLCYLLFYSMSTSVQNLGLDSLSANGIFFGITMAFGCLIVIPSLPKMRRKKWAVLFQVFILSGIVVLFYTSRLKKTASVKLLETIVSVCVIGTFMNSLFVLLFVYTSELFPTKMRGLANAIVLFTGKILGSFSPYLITWTLDRGYHMAVGCGLIVLLSLPLSLGLRETLVEEDSEVKKSRKLGLENVPNSGKLININSVGLGDSNITKEYGDEGGNDEEDSSEMDKPRRNKNKRNARIKL